MLFWRSSRRNVPVDEGGVLQDLEQGTPKLEIRSEIILEDLRNEKLICAICTDTIKPTASVWSCGQCHQIYHFGCLYEWASAKGQSTLHVPAEDEDEIGWESYLVNWECPTCKKKDQPLEVDPRCWCGRYTHASIPPTSDGSPPLNCCGRTCRKPFNCSQHPLDEQGGICRRKCHPGPCPLVERPQTCPGRDVEHLIRTSIQQNPDIVNEPRALENLSYTQRWNTIDGDVRRSVAAGFFTYIVGAISICFYTLAHLDWWTMPLKHPDFFLEKGDIGRETFIAVFFSIIWGFLSGIIGIVGFVFWPQIWKIVIDPRRSTPPYRKHTHLLSWVMIFLIFTIVGMVSVPAFLMIRGPAIILDRRIMNPCLGFDSRVTLNATGDFGNSIFVLNSTDSKPPLAQNHIFQTFTITDSPRNNTSSGDFTEYTRVQGNLNPTQLLAIDFDTSHNTYRMLTLSKSTDAELYDQANITKEFNYPTESAVIKTGKWNFASKKKPHIFIADLNLLIPSFFYFDKACDFGGYMRAYDTKGLNIKEIETLQSKDWDEKQDKRLMLRTVSQPSSDSQRNNIDICAKKGKEMSGMGDDVLIPLGLMAVLRRKTKCGRE